MPSLRFRVAATTTDALANRKFAVVPANGALINVWAACVTATDSWGLSIGDRDIVVNGANMNIEASADVVDNDRDQLVFNELIGGGAVVLARDCHNRGAVFDPLAVSLMAEFGSAALRNLDRIYQFVGGLRGLRQVELELPVQLVHDVSREAELHAAPAGGLWIIIARNVHTIAGVLNNIINPYTSANRLNGYTIDAARDWVWLMNGWANITAGALANLSEASISVRPALESVGLNDAVLTTPMPKARVYFWDTGTIANGMLRRTNASSQLGVQLPMPILPPSAGSATGGTIIFESVETGGIGITIDYGALIWTGRVGSYPPSMY